MNFDNFPKSLKDLIYGETSNSSVAQSYSLHRMLDCWVYEFIVLVVGLLRGIVKIHNYWPQPKCCGIQY